MKKIAYTCVELNRQGRWLHLYDTLKAKGYSNEEWTKNFGGTIFVSSKLF